MRVGWQRLAVGAEISIIAYSTLVAISSDIGLLVLAKRAITADVSVGDRTIDRAGNVFVDRGKPMTWVNVTGALGASRAVIPIWAV